MGIEDWLIQMGIALFIGIILIFIVTCLIQGTVEYFNPSPKPKKLKFIVTDEEIKDE